MTMNKKIQFAAIIILLVIVTLGGYGLFLVTVVKLMRQELVLGIGVVATIAGIASFFNPCAFPLLPAYLAQYFTHKEKEQKGRIITNGILAAVGVITFNIILGLLIGLLGFGFGKSLGLGGDIPNLWVRVVRGAIGMVLIFLGYSHASGKGLQFDFLLPITQRVARLNNPPQTTSNKKFYWYGFLYPLVGIGCGGPILAALSAYAVSLGGMAEVLTAFAIYSLVMGTLMVFVSILVAYSKESLLASLRGAVVPIKKTSGVLLMAVGVFLLLSSIFVQVFVGILFPRG